MIKTKMIEQESNKRCVVKIIKDNANNKDTNKNEIMKTTNKNGFSLEAKMLLKCNRLKQMIMTHSKMMTKQHIDK